MLGDVLEHLRVEEPRTPASDGRARRWTRTTAVAGLIGLAGALVLTMSVVTVVRG